MIHEKVFKAPVNTLMYNHGNAKIQNISTFQPLDVKNDFLKHENKQEFILNRTLIHEIVNSFQNKMYGDPRTLTYWKKKGYSDYIANQNFEKTIPTLIFKKITILKQQDFSHLKDSQGNWIPFDFLDDSQIKNSNFVDTNGKWYVDLYFISHLMTQYALDIKKLDYKTFMSADTK